MREGDYYCADKTPFIPHPVEKESYCSLSRPQHFGKSLFPDTLAEAFAANAALFQGLCLEDHRHWTKQYPVIRLDFGGGVPETQAALNQPIHLVGSEFSRDRRQVATMPVETPEQ